METARPPAVTPPAGVPRTYWKRRVAVMGVIALLIAVPLTIVLRSGGSGGAGSHHGAIPGVKKEPYVDGALGVKISIPKGWEAHREAGAVKLQSSDSSSEVDISSEPTSSAKDVITTALSAIQSNYQGVTPNAAASITSARIGGLAGKSVGLAATTKGGTPIHVFISAATHGSHTYLVEAFVAEQNLATRAPQALVALKSLQLG